MTSDKMALVIASNRRDQLEQFVCAWRGPDDHFPWDETILVWDGETFGDDVAYLARDPHGDLRPDVHVYSWTDLAPMPEWLSRHDAGIKAWGFAEAVNRLGCGIVITLDDDCRPSRLGCPAGYDPCAWFVNQHREALGRTHRWASPVAGLVPRGLPYGLPDPHLRDNSLGELPVMLNMGIWEGIPDRDAVHELTNYDENRYYRPWHPQERDYRESRVMSPHQYWPMSAMNLSFRAEAAPLLYLPRMGEGVPFRRFDDIWCGVIAQRIMRHLGWSAAVGRPVVRHDKASDPMDNLVREAPGIRANEHFWRVIDRIVFPGGMDTPLACMQNVGLHLQHTDLRVKDAVLEDYLRHLAGWIGQWCDLFVGAGWS